MKRVQIFLSDELDYFYSKIADKVELPIQQVLEDALFGYSAQLSIDALSFVNSQKNRN